MKFKFLAFSVLCATLSLSEAANYTISNVNDGQTDTLYADASNNLLATGIVTVGVFASGFDVNANLGELSTLVSNFSSIFASGAIGATSTSLGGSFAGYTENAAVDSAPLLTGNASIGRTLYSFIGNGATLATSTAVALLNMGNLQNEDGGELDYVSNPQFRVGQPLIGTIGSKTGNFGGQGASTIYGTLNLVVPVAVPEPSTAILGLIGACGLLRRRRN